MTSSNPASATKPWYQSLTVQGAIVGAVGAAVLTSGPSILTAFNIDPAVATAVCKNAAQLLADGAAAMTLIGRMRLGDLS